MHHSTATAEDRASSPGASVGGAGHSLLHKCEERFLKHTVASAQQHTMLTGRRAAGVLCGVLLQQALQHNARGCARAFSGIGSGVHRPAHSSNMQPQSWPACASLQPCGLHKTP